MSAAAGDAGTADPPTGVALVVLDGWGIAPEGPGNAVTQASTPTFDGLWERFPHSQLIACGPAVGLPAGQMGNSEVGHMNLGAGTVVKQALARIDDAVADGSIADVPPIRDLFAGAKGEDGTRIHVLGLVSDGGVHSSMDHLRALIAASADAGVPELVVHAFTDGRDTLPKAGPGYLEQVEEWCADAGNARVGSVVGRYFAMDRDERWDRVQQAFDVVVHGKAEHHASDAPTAVRDAHERGETDEFVAATTVGDEARIRPGDGVLVLNFRPDRVREITRAIAEDGFDDVDRTAAAPEGSDVGGGPVVDADRYVCMTTYNSEWAYPVAFGPNDPEVTLADVIEREGLAQVHVAETEKYPHVTYFFNGGVERSHEGEHREVVPSPRDVATYDEAPHMAARAGADAFVRLWREHEPGFGILNFANPDMVGHTGSIPAAIDAIQFVDGCLADVVEAVHAAGGVCLVTADHGNADVMLEPDGSPNTAHSLSPVPFVVTREGHALREEGVLADVAPTVLALLGIAQPPEMGGTSMLDG